ncbi:MAG: S46 family peptidase [Bacteroidales bacterium]|nr:S46 family peptidase [Bacteroidales bacterium]
MRHLFLFAILQILSLNAFTAKPDEGMWIPLLIEKYNIRLMQEKGFRLSSEDIYSINKASMKDAVVKFGGGCTGEFISPEGLLITNHHCGYSLIQSHSSLEHDYLTDGFWAMSGKEELPNPGLTVTILKRMEDVTEKVLAGTNDEMDSGERERIIASNIKNIESEAGKGNNYKISVRPFFTGNQYFMSVDEIFRDVRLVGAPPSSIGKFGGDTDNWVWPRHTGDFSLFRVYANRENQPAEYSPDNVPYKPNFYFPVSLRGINEGDFTLVIGYPGSTYQYVSSYHIDMIKNHINPRMIDVRTRKIEIIDEAMESDPLIRIKYSAKKASISNSWKKWSGEILGLEKMVTIEREREFEERLSKWINADSTRTRKYGAIFPAFREIYPVLGDYMLANNFTGEVMNGIEAVAFARNLRNLSDLVENRGSPEEIIIMKKRLIENSGSFFKNYDSHTDRKLFIALMNTYGQTLDEKWQIPEYLIIKEACRGNFEDLADKVYGSSVFTDEKKFRQFVNDFDLRSVRKLKKDVFFILSNGAADMTAKRIRPELTRLNTELQKYNRLYMKAQMEFQNEKVLYPDANSTLRVAFGKISGYLARDAVYLRHYTTLSGIIEKDNPEIYDYDVPGKLKELYAVKDYGRYGRDGQLNVCFIADNHTTGGNSGSPVLNAYGHLIGVNFDRGWEGVASDMAFNPDQSRNISLDIRYALFIIDKFAGAGYLLNEMTIIY